MERLFSVWIKISFPTIFKANGGLQGGTDIFCDTLSSLADAQNSHGDPSTDDIKPSKLFCVRVVMENCQKLH